nr:glycosyltransferase family 87 protein [Aromatoleum petrolei]
MGYAIFVGTKIIGGYRDAARGDTPLFTDFTPTYAASIIVRELPAEFVYMPRTMAAAGKEAARRIYGELTEQQAGVVGFAPWMYPPSFILLVLPLAYLPYLVAWAGWLGVTALPYLLSLRRILPERLGLPFALAAPPALFNVMYGQTGFLTAGLIGAGLLLLRNRPLWGGLLIGLASVKPHFGVLIPFALLAGGHWRAFAAASTSVLGLVALSVLALGDDPWFAFIGTSLFHLDAFTVGAFALPAMVTPWSAARLAGMTIDQAWVLQCLVSALMLAIVTWVWWRGRRHTGSHGLQAAVLCLATPLALPLAFLYDLALIVPAAAWLWADMRSRGAGREEYWLLAGGLAALLGAKELARLMPVQIAPWILALLLGLALYRFLSAVARDEATAT